VDELSRLAHAARLGEPGALEAFIDAAYDQVRRLCASLADERSADDLTQETFVRSVRSLGRFRGDASARTWLLSIARHVCLDELRRRGRQRGRDARLAAGRTAGALVAPDASEEVGVRDLLSRLEPDRRAAFVLTQLHQLSYVEAAAVCDCPTGTIRSRVARARDDLIAMSREREVGRSERTQSLGRPPSSL
jgi:RNA polymerase sigma-70 factor (ECF subfamily)